MISELNERSREIFRIIVDSYLETGDPIGSRTISKSSIINLSAASIRNTMSDLEEMGLLASPHTSAGRIPTQEGLRLYIDGLMEVGDLTEAERAHIKTECAIKGISMNDAIDKASSTLSNLSACASMVIAPKTDDGIKQVQFVRIEPEKLLVVLVMQNGLVENRVMHIPANITDGQIVQAANYINSKINGERIDTLQAVIHQEIEQQRTKLDQITQTLVQRGLALPVGKKDGHIIVRGQSKLLEDVRAIADLENARSLLNRLEEQELMLKLLDLVDDAQGVQIFLGTENKIFDQSGWSMILSPYKDMDQRIVGAIGVIGPTRLNYDRIIPMVDYTSKVISKMIENQS